MTDGLQYTVQIKYKQTHLGTCATVKPQGQNDLSMKYTLKSKTESGDENIATQPPMAILDRMSGQRKISQLINQRGKKTERTNEQTNKQTNDWLKE